MRLAILGATGGSGLQLIKESLARGHEVVALARSPEKITEKNDKLKVEKVDIFKTEEVAPHLRGCDAVLSGLGNPDFAFFSRVTFYEDSIQPIVAAMRQANVTRFVAITSWCTESEPGNPKIMEWIVKPLLIGRHTRSMAAMERFVFSECSDINCTFVRPPQLTDGASTGKQIQAAQGQFVPGGSSKISRIDVAKFMLDCLTTDKWDRKAVAVAP